MKAIHRYIFQDVYEWAGQERVAPVGEFMVKTGPDVVHSFREGNTRSQFVFFSRLAGQAGWRLEPAGFAPGTPGRDEFVAARFFSQATGSNEHLVRVLAREITPS